MPASYLWLIPLLPFAGFLINGTLGRRLPRALVSAVALVFTAIPAALWIWLWFSMKAPGAPQSIQTVATLFGNSWISISGFHADFALTVDHLTLIMLGVVTGVGFIIHVYSVGYMAHEEGYWRFFAYLNLFMFFMLVLVLASNFLLLFVGWEGVGLASYLLIGFYFRKDSAANAGKKAFILNRIGDFGFLLAMFLLVAHFGSLDFSTVFNAISQHHEWQGGFLTAIALLLVLGATGKSAQIPLYVWLPDAMEGPTPVSALIHAATMVTAGVYMVARCHVLFDHSPYALGVVAIIGAATAIFAACIGLVQHDIKRVLAYSTVSQLGYMFLGCGVGAYAAGIFHLLTHAFFKALLFLAAGSVIHALGGEQDMRKMGGLRKRIPVTFWTMTMGVVAIAGIPPLAGFFSKDEILFRAFTSDNPIGKLLWLVGLVTAGMTSFYMFRLWFKTFWGEERFEEQADLHNHGAAVHAQSDTHTVMVADHDDRHAGHAHGVHESPLVMTLPLMILALLSIIGGWVGIPAAMLGHDEIGSFLDPVFGAGAPVAEAVSHSTELGLAAVSVLAAAIGFYIAWLFYYRKPGMAAALAQRSPTLYRLVLNKFYIDELYGLIIVTPLLMFSRLILGGLVDTGLINGSGAAAGATTKGLSKLTRQIQSGNIRSYAGWLALGAAAVIFVMIFGRSLW
ncbi:NADH-quinone oxidoreductase subunit L [Edaphobacter bradus]|uniref:NADH-quinone oxidoreductase subunit L n=1 Tax=Edaphobacter bradus TaxID=2259016 RepID=UPI0021E05347|nr:NADH-quinone oxidoreductase subunit L [Edaphobacter bradus]